MRESFFVSMYKNTKLYEKDKSSPIPTEIAVKHLGYSSLNGASRTALSAMRKFGLIDYNGGNVRLSSLANDIVLPRHSTERLQAISTAILLPASYQRVLDEWPEWDLPSEVNLRNRLIKDWGFT